MQLYLTSHFCPGVGNLTSIFGKMSKSRPMRRLPPPPPPASLTLIGALHVLTNFYCVLLRQHGRLRCSRSPIALLHSRHADSSLHAAEGRKLQYLQFSYLRLTLVGFTCSLSRAHAMFLPCTSLGLKNLFIKRTAKMFCGITCT